MNTPRHPNAAAPASSGSDTPVAVGPWQTQRLRIPPEWAEPVYVIDSDPFREVFVQQNTYKPSKSYDLGPPPMCVRLREETAWWVFTCWNEGLMKIPVWVLRWWSEAIAGLAAASTRPASSVSVGEFAPGLVVREALKQFIARNGKMPAPAACTTSRAWHATST